MGASNAADILVFFSGVQGRSNAEDTAQGGLEVKENQQEIFEDLKKIPERPGYKRLDVGWFGSIILLRGVNAAFDYVTKCDRYNPPESKLIIYGYSAGGYNALQLCRDFDDYNTGSAGRNRLKAVSVDLLVTVDAAARGLTSTINRNVGDCVRNNINYYQEAFLGDLMNRSQGGPNRGKCKPFNIKYGGWLSGPSHGAMMLETEPVVLEAIAAFLGVKAP